jgi:hypothetical protein
MSLSKYQNEEYLRAEHLLKDGKYRTVQLPIEAVIEDCPLQRKLEPSKGYAIRFKGATKVLGLGTTNFSLVCASIGESDPANWIGKTLRIEVRKVRGKTKGTTQPAIRIIPPDGTELRSGLIKELGERYE